jgi:thioredoxin-like negative regulator of GroEL
MQRVFDTVLASSDMSLERVLNAGLPVALYFYEREIPGELRQALDNLARRYAGRALIVTLNRADSPQAASRFGAHQFPTLVTVKDGKTIASRGNVKQPDLAPYVAHLLDEGPMPVSRAPEPAPSARSNASTAPVSVNENDFNREVLQSDRPVLLAAEQSNLKIAKVNVDENPGLASKYRAMSIPTMIVVQGGREVDRWVGAMPENMLRSRVARWTQR